MKKHIVTILLAVLLVSHIIEGLPSSILGWINIGLLAVCIVLNLVDWISDRRES